MPSAIWHGRPLSVSSSITWKGKDEQAACAPLYSLALDPLLHNDGTPVARSDVLHYA
jgi:hypothetical protein